MSSTPTENEPKNAADAAHAAHAVADADANSSDSDVPQIYIMIENPKKSNNLGPILRCGAAYCATFIFIGFEKCAVEGSHGADKHVSILSFPTFGQACQYVRSQGVDVGVSVGGSVGADGCVGGSVGSITGILGAASFRKGGHDDVREVIVDEDGNENGNENGTTSTIKVGGEIGTPGGDFGDGHGHGHIHAHEREHKYPCSHPIHLRPFKEGPKKNICFLISKKAAGIPKDQAKLCDTFVHISTSVPFPLKAESESESESVMHGMLDSQTSLSICLHHFAAKWNFKERDFDSLQQKFEVADPKRNQVDEEQNRRLREARRRQKEDEEQALDDAWESGEMANMIHMFD